MFDKIKDHFAHQRQQRIDAMRDRISALIKSANTTIPDVLADYLIQHGVCDAQEVERREDNAEDYGKLIESLNHDD